MAQNYVNLKTCSISDDALTVKYSGEVGAGMTVGTTLAFRDTNQLTSESLMATLLSYIKVKAGQETAYEDMQALQVNN